MIIPEDGYTGYLVDLLNITIEHVPQHRDDVLRITYDRRNPVFFKHWFHHRIKSEKLMLQVFKCRLKSLDCVAPPQDCRINAIARISSSTSLPVN